MSTPARKPASSASRMAAYRKRMREAGYRQVQIWVPDTKAPEFIAEAHRQARLVAQHDPGGDEIMEWLDQVRDWPKD